MRRRLSVFLRRLVGLSPLGAFPEWRELDRQEAEARRRHQATRHIQARKREFMTKALRGSA